MQLAITAKNTTDGVRANLTYIESLINEATDNAKYFIIVDSVYMDDDMADNLVNNFGYRITKEYFDIGTYPRYKIFFGS